MKSILYLLTNMNCIISTKIRLCKLRLSCDLQRSAPICVSANRHSLMVHHHQPPYLALLYFALLCLHQLAGICKLCWLLATHSHGAGHWAEHQGNLISRKKTWKLFSVKITTGTFSIKIDAIIAHWKLCLEFLPWPETPWLDPELVTDTVVVGISDTRLRLCVRYIC